jgi:prevent-host-death family protein
MKGENGGIKTSQSQYGALGRGIILDELAKLAISSWLGGDMQVNILEAKNKLSQLVKRAQAGEEVVIANRGKPVARLVPAEKSAAQELPLGNGKRIVEWLRNHPLPAYARRSAEEIDAYIEEERNSWE